MNSKKMFKIRVHYVDSKTKAEHVSTVFFGSQDDYIFTKDAKKRLERLVKLKNIDNPLNSDYWRAMLCIKP